MSIAPKPKYPGRRARMNEARLQELKAGSSRPLYRIES